MNAGLDKNRVTDVFKKGMLSTEIEYYQDIWEKINTSFTLFLSNPVFAYFCYVIKSFKNFQNSFKKKNNKQPLMMAYEGSENAWDNFGKFIYQFQPETKTLIRKLERILWLLSNYTHTHIYIYIYIYILREGENSLYRCTCNKVYSKGQEKNKNTIWFTLMFFQKMFANQVNYTSK